MVNGRDRSSFVERRRGAILESHSRSGDGGLGVIVDPARRHIVQQRGDCSSVNSRRRGLRSSTPVPHRALSRTRRSPETFTQAIGDDAGRRRAASIVHGRRANLVRVAAAPRIDANSIGRVEVAMSNAAPGTVFALVGDRSSGGFLGLFKFDEASSTWSQLAAAGITNSIFGTQQTYDLVLAVDPGDPQRIYLAGVRAFRSLDGGATFRPMAQDVHVDWHVIVFDPNDPTILWAGTDGGVYLSTDGGDSWSSRSAGLAITQFYPGVSVHPQGTRISGGSQDNGTHVFTGTPFWDAFHRRRRRIHGHQLPEPQRALGRNAVVGVHRRQPVSTGRRAPRTAEKRRHLDDDRAQFIPPLVMDPVNPAKLYFGTFRLYQTTNEGVSWTALGGDLTGGRARSRRSRCLQPTR